MAAKSIEPASAAVKSTHSAPRDIHAETKTSGPSRASATATQLNIRWQRMQRWGTLEGSHCTSSNVDGAFYDTSRPLMKASDLIKVQLKMYRSI